MPKFIHPNLDRRLHGALRGIMSSSCFSKGTALYREGAEATGFYLVESGSVRVLLADDRCHHVLDTVGAGVFSAFLKPFRAAPIAPPSRLKSQPTPRLSSEMHS